MSPDETHVSRRDRRHLTLLAETNEGDAN